MFYLLLGIAVGVIVTYLALARGIARNRRRIEALERQCGKVGRHQKAQDLVIRHLAEEGIEPDEPPPDRREYRVLKRAAVLAGLWALIRRHPVRAGLAAAATVGTVIAVTLPTLSQATPPAAGAMGVPSTRVAVSALASTPAAPGSGAPSASTPTTAVPSIAPASSLPAAPTSGLVSVAVPAAGGPTVVPTAASSSAPASLPQPSSAPPTVPSASASPPLPSSSGSPSHTCAVDLNLPPLLGLCLL